MDLSIKELDELQLVLKALDSLEHLRLSEIAVYDGTEELIGRLVCENGTWSFEFGDPNDY